MEPRTSGSESKGGRLVACVAQAVGSDFVSALSYLEEVFGAPSVVWAPRRGDEDGLLLVGFGVAAEVTGRGAERFEQVKSGVRGVFERLQNTNKLPFPPRMFGGFSFDPESIGVSLSHSTSKDGAPARSSLPRTWSIFGDARFILPRVLYASGHGQAYLMGFAEPSEEATLGSQLAGCGFGLRTGINPLSQRYGHFSGLVTSPDPSASRFAIQSAWEAMVRSALLAIERGALSKVVLARAEHLRFEKPPSTRAALLHLVTNHRDCACFLFQERDIDKPSPLVLGRPLAPSHQRNWVTFLGATPERLVAVKGRHVSTEALAGSIGRRLEGDDTEAREALLASAKDRAEHAFVTLAIQGVLAPFCETLSAKPEPEVRSLPHVHHLATPISGTLRENTHVLDLVQRLHPTPALCGTPTESARAFISAEEVSPRGWYGGAVGYVDSAGDGSFAVAIRSALVTAEEGWIYAGAGIVKGSDPESEYIETTIKTRTMMDALGIAS